MEFFRQVIALLRKDIIVELRTKEILVTMFLFVILTMVIFNYAFGTTVADLTFFSGGMLWIAFVFASLLGLNRSFVHEKDEGCLEGLLLCPSDRPVIYFSKMLGNFIFLTVIGAVAIPVFTFFFVQQSYLPRLGLLVLAVLLSNLGISVVGTLLATVSMNTRMRDVMLPILFLPIIIPLLVMAVRSTSGIIGGIYPLSDIYAALYFLAVYDSIFLLVAYGLYDFVIGE